MSVDYDAGSHCRPSLTFTFLSQLTVRVRTVRRRAASEKDNTVNISGDLTISEALARAE